MNIKTGIVFFVALVLFSFSGKAQTEIFNPVRDAIKTGNAKEVVKYFNQSVDINLEGTVNTHSKAQAEFVLRDFFKKHPITEFKIVHTGSSKGGLQFAIGKYISSGEIFNVLMRVREVGTSYLVHEISFTTDSKE
jgi:Domain of unknown function (DUF4783)